MAEERAQRRLAAIVAVDLVGYTRMVQADEAGTIAALRAWRGVALEPLVVEHGGRIVKLMGDGALLEFSSAVNALECAVDLQRRTAESNDLLPADRALVLRIGVNLGDIVVEGDDIFGDGVNVAARLEAMAEPGGIYLSGKVFDEVSGKLELEFDELGQVALKHARAISFAMATLAMRAAQALAPNLREYRCRTQPTGRGSSMLCLDPTRRNL